MARARAGSDPAGFDAVALSPLERGGVHGLVAPRGGGAVSRTLIDMCTSHVPL